MDMRQIVIFVVLGLVLSFGLPQLIIYLSSNHHGRTILGSVANGLIIGALILLSDPVTLAVAHWSGLKNIGWYLGYVMAAVGCFFYGRIVFLTDLHRYGLLIGRCMRIALAGLLLLLSAVYLMHLMHAPEWLARTPRTVWELLFSSSFFLFCATIALLVGTTFAMAIPREENPAQRLRLWLYLLSSAVAVLFFVSKWLYLTLCYLYADLIWLDQMAHVALASVGLLTSLAVMPGGVLRLLFRLNPATYLSQLWRLFWLKRLSAKLYDLMPDLVWRRYGLSKQLRNTSLSTYRALIAILDGKKSLAGCLEMDGLRRQRVAGIAWSEEQWQQATSLNLALQQIDYLGDEEYLVLVKEVVRISRQMNRTTLSASK